MKSRTDVAAMHVADELYAFVADELLPQVEIEPDRFWNGLAAAFAELAPTNDQLLAERDRLQARIDEWLCMAGNAVQPNESAAFLTSIGYLVAEPEPFTIQTRSVDEEIASLCGPQLVVPVLNARFALNAVNARWGSLYDSLYGTDALGEPPAAGPYDSARGVQVVAHVRDLLDEFVPLLGASHCDVDGYAVIEGELVAQFRDRGDTALVDNSALRGYRGEASEPSAVLLRHHGLHLELIIDRNGRIGKTDPAGIEDVLLESALTTIVDFEDSVAAVDAADKVLGYRNWLGLNTGTLVEKVAKAGGEIERRLEPDRSYTTPQGGALTLPGRAVMLVRNVGHHMRTDAVLDRNGHEVYEGILDAFVTVLAAVPGLRPDGERVNSRAGSIYVVKPKMHGPAEVAFTARLFELVEDTIGLPRLSVKIGVMDEERRTSVNLAACISEVRDRIVFVNTGFLDRSGDEIHTAMEAGPIVRKDDLRHQAWFRAYEDHNVDVALAAGLPGKAQVGKGMWAMPDLMASMLEEKVAHPMAGASTAWVPSPTAATLHAIHYHRVDVEARQLELARRQPRSSADLMWLPVVTPPPWSEKEVIDELENNAQSILGYVVRWVDQGIGCSKVPDSREVALMEDRATLRISSQLMANWLRHDVVSETDVRRAFLKMAAVVDAQNAHEAGYRPMSVEPESSDAFQASLELVLSGADQPNGYCEPILHKWRRRVKAAGCGSTTATSLPDGAARLPAVGGDTSRELRPGVGA